MFRVNWFTFYHRRTENKREKPDVLRDSTNDVYPIGNGRRIFLVKGISSFQNATIPWEQKFLYYIIDF